MRILDLGCGTSKLKNAIGVDIVPLSGVDVFADASSLPYPFADCPFDGIHMMDIIEHLPDTVAVMEEVYRVARPNAQVYVRVVNWSHRYAAMDSTHVRQFTEGSFDFFGKRIGRSSYTLARFDVVQVKYIFDKKVQRWLRSRRIMKFLSDCLCNIQQGPEFELRAVEQSLPGGS